MRDFDALLPPEIAQKAELLGAEQTRLDAVSLLILAVLAGAFIAMGAMFATTTLAGADGVLPFGVSRLLAGQFLLSLAPVSLGNIIGGGVLVGAVYWFVYLRPGRSRAHRSPQLR